MQDWDLLIQTAGKLIESREKYQRILGEIAYNISKEFGFEKLKDFSRDVQESFGLTISPATLKNYKWVYDHTHELDLPEDLSYRTLQYIASSGNPQYWANKIKNEGLSSADVFHLMRIEKGLDKKKEPKKIICPSCGETIDLDEEI